DLESRESLEEALDAFPGTVLLVSHDRALLDAIAERTLAIEDGELHAYDGGPEAGAAAERARASRSGDRRPGGRGGGARAEAGRRLVGRRRPRRAQARARRPYVTARAVGDAFRSTD